MITVGLDFGTHQTKICVENKEGVGCEYSFFKFEDEYYREYYTLPSVINVATDGLLTYGYIKKRNEGRIIRYFKQAAFCPNPNLHMPQINALYFSTWYIAYILFDLENKYGKNFTIQMGAPADSEHLSSAKQIAVRILVSAYKLVEEVFMNDKKRFLQTTMKELVELTTIIPYSDEIKEEYGILVFPEAYACLKPLTSKGKISTGMSLMVDIGGGTTDVSFFTIEDGIPQVYDFFSLDKGLNYLTKADKVLKIDRKDSNVKASSEIDTHRRNIYIQEINRACNSLLLKLQKEFKRQTSLNMQRLMDALKNRPLIYCGGGSTFNSLQVAYCGFMDKKLISHREWEIKSIVDADDIIDSGLCPILSTAYGLSISVPHDNITRKPFNDIFENIRGTEEETKIQTRRTFSSVHGGFSYTDDWDAMK